MNEPRHLTCDDCPVDPYGAEQPVLPQLLRFMGWVALSVLAYVGVMIALNFCL